MQEVLMPFQIKNNYDNVKEESIVKLINGTINNKEYIKSIIKDNLILLKELDDKYIVSLFILDIIDDKIIKYMNLIYNIKDSRLIFLLLYYDKIDIDTVFSKYIHIIADDSILLMFRRKRITFNDLLINNIIGIISTQTWVTLLLERLVDIKKLRKENILMTFRPIDWIVIANRGLINILHYVEKYEIFNDEVLILYFICINKLDENAAIKNGLISADLIRDFNTNYDINIYIQKIFETYHFGYYNT